jgi:hypothetical protein
MPRKTLHCHLCFASADGNYHITTMTKATLYHHGLVKWEPPAIFKSSCDIDVRYRKRHSTPKYSQQLFVSKFFSKEKCRGLRFKRKVCNMPLHRPFRETYVLKGTASHVRYFIIWFYRITGG